MNRRQEIEKQLDQVNNKIERLRKDLDSARRSEAILSDALNSYTRAEKFFLCRHGFHKMDRKTSQPTFPTPGTRGVCKKCGMPITRYLV